MRRVVVPAHVDPAAPPFGLDVLRLQGRTMGTSWSARLAAAAGDAPRWQRGIQLRLDEVVAQMSHWEPASDLGRYNRADAGSLHVLPAEFTEVLACACRVAEASSGAYDPAAGALVDLWGFGPPGPRAAGIGLPDDAAIAAAMARPGWRHLELDPAARRVRQPGGLQLDLSSIAKGYAVDHVSRWLSGLGITNHLVEVGGELRGSGIKPDGQPWWVALEQPHDGETETGPIVVALHGLSVATSGDYLRCFVHDGQRYAHTLDPRSGRPITHGLASVTVLHADCMAADAWSTAMTVLGPQAGAELAQRHGLAARFLTRQAGGTAFDEYLSPALRSLLQ